MAAKRWNEGEDQRDERWAEGVGEMVLGAWGRKVSGLKGLGVGEV